MCISDQTSHNITKAILYSWPVCNPPLAYDYHLQMDKSRQSVQLSHMISLCTTCPDTRANESLTTKIIFPPETSGRTCPLLDKKLTRQVSFFYQWSHVDVSEVKQKKTQTKKQKQKKRKEHHCWSRQKTNEWSSWVLGLQAAQRKKRKKKNDYELCPLELQHDCMLSWIAALYMWDIAFRLIKG